MHNLNRRRLCCKSKLLFDDVIGAVANLVQVLVGYLGWCNAFDDYRWWRGLRGEIEGEGMGVYNMGIETLRVI